MTSRSFLSRLLWACLVALACACAKVTEAPELGTNTNWLKACNDQAECGSEDACVCGVCTRACDDDSACGAVNDKTRCQAPSENACGVLFQAPARACLQACSSDGDCSALEHGRCVDHLCVPGPSGAPTESSEPAQLWRIDEQVVVTDAYTVPCLADSDCTLARKSCSCCGLTAIHVNRRETFESERARVCSDYRGPICRCDYPDVVARCDEGSCRAVARDMTSCYSPGQNLDLAYRDDALGCRCQAAEAQICVDRVALACRREGDLLYAWSAIEDGPCGEASGDLDGACAMGERIASADSCIRRHKSCYQLGNGEFCGER